MSIFYICGKPRGGKTYQAIVAICNELRDRKSKRNIVTNLPLKFDDYEREYMHYPPFWGVFFWWLLGWWRGVPKPRPERRKRWAHGLKWFVSEHCPHMTLLDLKQRIRILEDDETGEFWLYEPGWSFDARKEITLNRRGTKIDVPDFTYIDGSVRGDENAGNPGTLYVIDEVHIFFPARAWQRTGEDCTFFLSQHGKMKCDVIMVTQHPDQCDKALRNLAQEYMNVRNLKREPIMGMRLGNRFRVTRMFNSPKSGNPQVFDTAFVGMDWKTYGDLYDTSAGVGVQGSLVPNDEVRGMHYGWAVAGLALFVALCLYGTFHARQLGQCFSWLTRSASGVFVNQLMDTGQAAAKKGQAVAGVSAPSPQAPAVPAPQAPAVVPSSMPAASTPGVKSSDTNELYCVGFSLLFNSPVVYMSDGSTVGPDDGLACVEKTRVMIHGQWYPVKKSKVRSMVTAQSSFESRAVAQASGRPIQQPAISQPRQVQIVEDPPEPEIIVVPQAGVVRVGPTIHSREAVAPTPISGIRQQQSY